MIRIFPRRSRTIALVLAACAVAGAGALWAGGRAQTRTPGAGVALSDQEMAGIVGAFTRPKITHYSGCPYCNRNPGGGKQGEQGADSPSVDPTTGSVHDMIPGPSVSAVGGGARLVFTYNSDMADGSNTALRMSMGYGWTHTYEMCLMESGRDVLWLHGDGSVSGFRGHFGAYSPLPGEFGTLAAVPGGLRTTTTDGTVYLFDRHVGANTPGDRWLLGTITDANARVTHLNYDGLNRLTGVVDAFGNTLLYTYDAQSRVNSVSDASGRVMTFFYDPKANNLTYVTLPDGSIITYTYSPTQQITGKHIYTGTLVTAESYTLTWNFRTQRIQRITDAGGATVYSASSNWSVDRATSTSSSEMLYHPGVTSITDGLGHVWKYTYDSRGLLTQLEEPLVSGVPAVTTYTYDPVALMVSSQTDPLGRVTTYQYDTRGNLVQQTDPQGNAVQYTYAHPTIPSLRTQRTEPGGRVTAYAYDPQGNMLTEVDALGHATSYGYDGQGRRTSTVDRNGHVTTYAYDAQSHVTSTTRDPGGLGITTQYTYDAVGRTTSMIDPNGHTTMYTYDARDRVLSTTAPLSRTTTYQYDERGNLTRTTDPKGHVTQYQYDNRNRRTTTTDATGHVSTTTYDAAGNRTQATDAAGRVTIFQYDTRNRLTTEVQDSTGVGATTRFTYDAAGNTLTQTREVAPTDGFSRVTVFTYDALNRVVTETHDPGGLNLTTMYDYALPGPGCGCGGTPGHSNIHKRTDPRGEVTYTYYDALDRRTSVVRKVGDAADNQGDADDAITRTTYDSVGNVLETRIVNAPSADVVTTFTYDGADRRTTEVRDPAGAALTTTFAYDAEGNTIQTVTPEGNVVTMTYDAGDRRTATADSRGPVVSMTYDLDGNRTSSTDGDGHTTTYTYDSLNRQVTEVDALIHMTTTAYDAAGNAITSTDRNGHVTQFQYDGLNRRTSQMRDPGGLGVTTQYAYDAIGNLRYETTPNTTQSGPAPQVTEHRYDGMDRRSRTIYADDENGHTRQTTFTYDADGNCISTTNQNGDATGYVYDDLNRLTMRTFTPSGGSPTYPSTQGPDTYTYDRGSRLITTLHHEGAPDPDSLTTTVYDGASRIIQTTQDGRTTTYSYDVGPGNNRRTMTYPSGRTVREGYDERARLTTITDQPSGEAISTFAYDAANRVLSQTRGAGGITTTSTYDAADRMIRSVDGLCMDTEIGYDFKDNPLYIRRSHASDLSEKYSYDAADRIIDYKRGTLLPDNSDTASLTASGVLTQRQQWTLDQAGNWLGNSVRVSGNDTCQDRYPNKANEVTQMVTGFCPSPVAGGGFNPAYDDNGSMLSDPNSNFDGGLLYDYDIANRLTRVRRGSDNVTLARYYYDARDRRIRIIGGTDTTIVFNHDWQAMCGYDTGTGVLVAEHVYGSTIDQRICTDRNLNADSTATGAGDQRLYRHWGLTSSVSALSTGTGDLVEAYLYDPYGRHAVLKDGPDADSVVNFGADDGVEPDGVSDFGNTSLFTGRDYDPGTALYDFRNRCYTPSLGLFLTRDPAGLQAGPNMYGYVSARPTVSVDPFGLAEQALNIKNVSGPTMGYCGAFDWRIKWELENAAAKPSWIVQHIVFTIHVENCYGQDVTRNFGVNPVTEYWEGWPVSKRYKTDGYARSYGVSDMYTGKGFGLCTIGMTSIKGDASYYEDVARLPAIFRTNNRATLAGILPATTVNPNLDGGTEPLAHEIAVTWNCCPRIWRKTELAGKKP